MLSATDTLTVEQAYTVASFFRDFGNTNVFVKDAKEMNQSNPQQLRVEVLSLMSAITDYTNINLTALQSADFEKIVNEHLTTFEADYERAKTVATKLWQTYTEQSNRLDYMDMNSDEYRSLMVECDATKASYDKAHSECDTLYDIYRKEQEKYAFVHFTTPECMDVLLERLKSLSERILAGELNA